MQMIKIKGILCIMQKKIVENYVDYNRNNNIVYGL